MSAVITMSEHVVPSAVAHSIFAKFVTNEKSKPSENLKGLRAQFGDETFRRTQMYDWSNSFKEGRTEVENM
jgi:hypothetical protein